MPPNSTIAWATSALRDVPAGVPAERGADSLDVFSPDLRAQRPGGRETLRAAAESISLGKPH